MLRLLHWYCAYKLKCVSSGGLHNSVWRLHQFWDSDQVHDGWYVATWVPYRSWLDTVCYHHVGRGSWTHHTHRCSLWSPQSGMFLLLFYFVKPLPPTKQAPEAACVACFCPCFPVSVQASETICFHDISSIHRWIFAEHLSLVHLGTNMNWLGFGVKKVKGQGHILMVEASNTRPCCEVKLSSFAFCALLICTVFHILKFLYVSMLCSVNWFVGEVSNPYIFALAHVFCWCSWTNKACRMYRERLMRTVITSGQQVAS